MTTRGIRQLAALGVFTIVALAGALAATATNSAIVKTAHNATYGSLLVNSSGLTLYHLTSETKGMIKCTGACATLWPPVLVKGGAKPSAGAGLSAAKLGTIRRPGGQTQVTYNGLPLYRYSDDLKPGETASQGLNGFWYAVTPAGTITKGHTARVGPCAPGQIIPQGAVDDDDDDNTVNGPSDGDGCY